MADIRNWDAYKRGRWCWTAGGYEEGFPRGCAFTDLDAVIEFNGFFLVIEAKEHAEGNDFPYPDNGQKYLLREFVKRGILAWVLYGNAEANDPHAVRRLGRTRPEDEFEKLLPLPLEQRRARLKQMINTAMGVGQELNGDAS